MSSSEQKEAREIMREALEERIGANYVAAYNLRSLPDDILSALTDAGLVTVPVEPTEAMDWAASSVLYRGTSPTPNGVWKAMITAYIAPPGDG